MKEQSSVLPFSSLPLQNIANTFSPHLYGELQAGDEGLEKVGSAEGRRHGQKAYDRLQGRVSTETSTPSNRGIVVTRTQPSPIPGAQQIGIDLRPRADRLCSSEHIFILSAHLGLSLNEDDWSLTANDSRLPLTPTTLSIFSCTWVDLEEQFGLHVYISCVQRNCFGHVSTDCQSQQRQRPPKQPPQKLPQNRERLRYNPNKVAAFARRREMLTVFLAWGRKSSQLAMCVGWDSQCVLPAPQCSFFILDPLIHTAQARGVFRLRVFRSVSGSSCEIFVRWDLCVRCLGTWKIIVLVA